MHCRIVLSNDGTDDNEINNSESSIVYCSIVYCLLSVICVCCRIIIISHPLLFPSNDILLKCTQKCYTNGGIINDLFLFHPSLVGLTYQTIYRESRFRCLTRYVHDFLIRHELPQAIGSSHEDEIVPSAVEFIFEKF